MSTVYAQFILSCKAGESTPKERVRLLKEIYDMLVILYARIENAKEPQGLTPYDQRLVDYQTKRIADLEKHIIENFKEVFSSTGAKEDFEATSDFYQTNIDKSASDVERCISNANQRATDASMLQVLMDQVDELEKYQQQIGDVSETRCNKWREILRSGLKKSIQCSANRSDLLRNLSFYGLCKKCTDDTWEKCK